MRFIVTMNSEDERVRSGVRRAPTKTLVPRKTHNKLVKGVEEPD